MDGSHAPRESESGRASRQLPDWIDADRVSFRTVTMEMTEWKQRIVELVLVKQKLAELGSKGLWQHRLPSVAATEGRLKSVEAHLGEALDPDYRAFLLHGDGWLAFYQTVDLFGSDDLMGNHRFHRATEMLRNVDDSVLISGGLRREDLLPIAASPVDLDLFVMTRRSASPPGMVVWLAGSEIDRFPSFDEYFIAMVDYNRLEVQHLQSEAS
jgi:SMI1-KNR4 cell-wall